MAKNPKEFEVEENIARMIAKKVYDRLLGVSEEFRRVYDKPSKIFFVGTLIPSGKEKSWKSVINPSAMGVEFLIENSESKKEIEITIQFDLYYRVYPNFKEQKEYIEAIGGSVEEKKDPLRPVFKRERFTSTAFVRIPKIGEKISLFNFFKEDFEKFIEKIEKDPEIYRNKGTATWSSRHLESEESYNAYLKSRNGSIPKIPWRFDVNIECNGYEANKLLIRVKLENTASSTGRQKHDPTLFNAQLKIRLINVKLYPFELNFLKDEYGYNLKLGAKGIGCVTEFDEQKNIIHAHHVPIVEIFRRYPRKSVNNIFPTFELLEKDPIQILSKIKKEMEKYILKKEKTVLESNVKARELIDRFKEEMKRFEDGIDFLSKDDDAQRAFKLMNRVMKLATQPDIKGWYIYQILFIVANLKSVKGADLDCVEVLKVPTGGGKTFCYLGLMIFAAFYERLKGKEYGVTAWIKFPLRMLSLQQLEVITKFICYANKVKKEERIPGDDISVGYLVGRQNTPNKIKEALEKIERGEIDFKIISNCPFCSAPIEILPDKQRMRIYHSCKNPKCRDGKKLPVIVVDYEVYRTLPTFIISTLDKVTIFNFNYRAKGLLGGKIRKCPFYGYNNSKWCLCKDEKGLINCNEIDCIYFVDGKCSMPVSPGYPPTILVQDEMHMIREDHGCLDSLYETLIDEIIHKIGGRRIKIFSATATISGVRQQVNNLYQRTARPFPTTFISDDFYFEDSNNLHRLIIGIMPHARALNYAVWQIVYECWREVQELLINKDKFAKELHISSQQFEDIIYGKYYTIVTYNRSKREANELPEGIKAIVNELLRKENLLEIKEKNIEIITGEKRLEDLRKLMSRIKTRDIEKKVKLIGATMAISHGIDFDELNIMIFQSMPQSVSEYIQAMSRVGRKYPAIVFVVFHGNRARDNSYYKYFNVTHKVIHELIEEVPLSRWAKNAIKLVSPGGILTVLHTYFAETKGEHNDRILTYMFANDLLYALNKKLLAINEISEVLKVGFAIRHAPTPEYQKEFERVIDDRIERLIEYVRRRATFRDLTSTIVSKIFKNAPIWSFRGVDDQVFISPTETSFIVEDRLSKQIVKEPVGEEKESLPEERKEDIYDSGEDGGE